MICNSNMRIPFLKRIDSHEYVNMFTQQQNVYLIDTFCYIKIDYFNTFKNCFHHLSISLTLSLIRKIKINQFELQ